MPLHRRISPTAARKNQGNAARQRRGRALVECIVAALLLAITGVTFAATARGTLAQADDAALLSRAQALTTTRIEDLLMLKCAATVNGTDAVPRVGVSWWQTAGPGARSTQLHAEVTLTRSPIVLGAGASTLLSVEAGGVCR